MEIIYLEARTGSETLLTTVFDFAERLRDLFELLLRDLAENK